MYWKNETNTNEEQDVIHLLSVSQYILHIRISSYVAQIQMLSLVVSDGSAGQCSSGGEKLDLIYGLEYEVLKDLLGPCSLDHVDEGTFEVTVLKP